MRRHKFTVHHNVSARRAQITCRTFIPAVTSKQLDLDGYVKILSLCHAFGRLTVQHDSAVSKGPSRPAGCLLSRETILQAQNVVRELVLVKNVPEFPLEFVIPVVANLQDTALHTECVSIIVIQFVASNLDLPTLKVLSVKEADKSAFTRSPLFGCTTTNHTNQSKAQDALPLLKANEQAFIQKLSSGHLQSLLLSVTGSLEQVRLQKKASICRPLIFVN